MKEKILILNYHNGQARIFIEREKGADYFAKFIKLLRKQKVTYSIEFAEVLYEL